MCSSDLALLWAPSALCDFPSHSTQHGGPCTSPTYHKCLEDKDRALFILAPLLAARPALSLHSTNIPGAPSVCKVLLKALGTYR